MAFASLESQISRHSTSILQKNIESDMRIFVDTNIVSELLEERSLVDYIDQIFEKAEQKGWTRVLSVGSFYTITFLTERFLRHQGIGQP